MNAVKQDLEFKCKELKDGNKGIEERFQQLTTALETTELNMKKLMEVVKN